jgi:hypothetical protein
LVISCVSLVAVYCICRLGGDLPAPDIRMVITITGSLVSSLMRFELTSILAASLMCFELAGFRAGFFYQCVS